MELNKPDREDVGRTVRSSTRKLWKDDATSTAAKISFSRDTAKLWKKAPSPIKNAPNLYSAKKEIKKHCSLFKILLHGRIFIIMHVCYSIVTCK